MVEAKSTIWASCVTSLVILFILGFTGSAHAQLTGEFKRFEQCPYDNPDVSRCVSATTTGGTVVLGHKRVPITNPVVLQGGYGAVGKDEFASTFVAAKDGATLVGAAQPIPGGLVGIVPPKGSSPLVKTAVAFFFENGLTGVNAILELAKSASAIRISENHLSEETGVALELPVKIRLENPFLGGECYIGSSSSPIIWKLRTAPTSPPAPNIPIAGKSGKLELLEEGSLLKLKDAELVDNAWGAPSASGCGGFLSFFIDPMINKIVGLPAPAGHNTTILVNTVYEGPSDTVKSKGEEGD